MNTTAAAPYRLGFPVPAVGFVRSRPRRRRARAPLGSAVWGGGGALALVVFAGAHHKKGASP